MSDYSELKRLAEAAGSGQWGYDGSYVCPARTEDGTTYVESWRAVADCYQPENAKFIAAANPAVVLALIAENERLRQQTENRRVDLEELGRKYSALCRHSAQMGRAFHKDVNALRQNSDRYEKLRRLQPGEITGLFIAQQRLMFGKLYYVGPLFGSALDKEVDAIKEAQ